MKREQASSPYGAMSIAELRMERTTLAQRARDLLASENYNAATSADVDKIMAKVDNIDEELGMRQLDMGTSSGGARSVERSDWVDASTGRRIPIAHAGDDFAALLGPAFKGGMTSPRHQHDIGEYVRGIAGLRTHESIRAALSEGTDSAGGFTLPSYVQLRMLEAMVPASALLTAGAGVGMLEEGAKSYRIAAVNAIPTAAWRAEGGALATSDPTFRSVDLVPRSLAFTFKVSRELLADSPNLGPALNTIIGQAFAREIDRAGLRGTGTPPEIRGVLNTSGIQAVTNGANGASLGTTGYANHISALQAILAADGPAPTAAIMAPRSFTTLAGLLDTTNQPRRVPPAIETWKLIPTSQIPVNLTVGTSSDCTEIYVSDFRRTVAFFFREGVSIQKLNELYAGTGEIGFACHARVDVGILDPGAIAVVTGVRA